MIPFVDIHVHLYAGLDDGPKTPQDAIEMCALAVENGTGIVAPVAHQGEGWPDNSASRIREAFTQLQERITEAKLPLVAYPNAELMIHPGMEDELDDGHCLTLGDKHKYLLIELPTTIGLDARPLAQVLLSRGLTPIFAHIERYPNLFTREDALEDLAGMGCLLQVNANAITEPFDKHFEKMLRGYVARNLVHLIASDGHSVARRPPKMKEAYETLVQWQGEATADRLCSLNARQLLEGTTFRVPPVLAKPKVSWFHKIIGKA